MATASPQENSITTSSCAASVKTTNLTRRRCVMDQTNMTDLSLLEFLDIIGAALDSPEGWDNSEDTWMKYVDKTGVPTNHEYHFTDWVEVGPAMKGLAAMIRTGVFK
jgi:hypothetical protein